MGKEIIVLGKLGDSKVCDHIDDIIEQHGLDRFFYRSKLCLQSHLEKVGTVIPNTEFSTQTGFEEDETIYEAGFEEDIHHYKMPKYRSENVVLLIAYTLLKESGAGAYVIDDGEEFARQILPGTPKLIVHYRDYYGGYAKLPCKSTLKSDFGGRVYHIAKKGYEMTSKRKWQAGNLKVRSFVEEFLKGGYSIPLKAYLRIVR